MRSISPNRITLGGATAVLPPLLAALRRGLWWREARRRRRRRRDRGRLHGPPLRAQSPDGELLNKVLARQEGVVAAYKEVTPHLAPRFAHMASYFRAQEEEHVDAVVKALRGIEAPAGSGPEEIEAGRTEDG